MLISWNGETTPDVDLESEIRAAAAAGYGGIEIFVPKLASYLERHTPRDLGRQLREAGLVAVSLNGLENINLRTRDEFGAVKAECKRLAEIAADCGCRAIVIVPSPIRQGLSLKDIIAQSADEIRELAAVAAPCGVNLALEFLGPVTCSVRTLSLSQSIVERAAHQSPALTQAELGIVFDTYHFFTGGSTLDEISPASARWIQLVHINDVEDKPVAAMTDADRVLPGEGVLPLKPMLRAVAHCGFDGAYSLEVMRPAYRARAVDEYMGDARRKVGQMLESIG